MKNIVCPVSSERIDENIPRIIGIFVVVILIAYIINGILALPIFLVIDFYLRGFTKGKYSLLSLLAKNINKGLPNKGEVKLINKAPKMFAARLGLVFSFLIVSLHFIGWPSISYYLSATLIAFAALEGIVNFCVGCVVFTWFVKPYTG